MSISVNKLLYQWYNKLLINFYFVNGTTEFPNIFKMFFSTFIIILLVLEKQLFCMNSWGSALVNR